MMKASNEYVKKEMKIIVKEDPVLRSIIENYSNENFTIPINSRWQEDQIRTSQLVHQQLTVQLGRDFHAREAVYTARTYK